MQYQMLLKKYRLHKLFYLTDTQSNMNKIINCIIIKSIYTEHRKTQDKTKIFRSIVEHTAFVI